MNKQTTKIYTRWLAYELRKRNFKIVKTGINEYHPELTVWFFESSKELEQAILELTRNRNND